ncbi:MAG: GNAT family N-acetyltransferase [Allobranchiibius sp.]
MHRLPEQPGTLTVATRTDLPHGVREDVGARALLKSRSTVNNMTHFDPMPDYLSTDRLRLRPWTEADAPPYRDLWLERDPRSLRVVSADGRPTVEDLRDNIRSELATTALTGFGLMAVEGRAERNFIGYCGLIGRDASPDQPELAYELLRAAHRRGYGTEAARAVLDAAAATGRSRLWAAVRVWNTASLRVLEKLGFVSSGQVNEDREHGDSVLLTRRLTRPS